jgi:hypothetical protein
VFPESEARIAVVCLALRDARRGCPSADPYSLACSLDEEAECAKQELSFRHAILALSAAANRGNLLTQLASPETSLNFLLPPVRISDVG